MECLSFCFPLKSPVSVSSKSKWYPKFIQQRWKLNKNMLMWYVNAELPKLLNYKQTHKIDLCNFAHKQKMNNTTKRSPITFSHDKAFSYYLYQFNLQTVQMIISNTFAFAPIQNCLTFNYLNVFAFSNSEFQLLLEFLIVVDFIMFCPKSPFIIHDWIQILF